MDTTEVPPERPAGLARRPAAGVQDPGAGMRACSYHASPGVSKASVLCISLWMICLNTLVSRCAAVDERGCGKVDNYQKRLDGGHQYASAWIGFTVPGVAVTNDLTVN